MSEIFVEVLLDQSLPKPLDYLLPEELVPRAQVGMRVEVPLKSTLKKGVIAKIKKKSSFSQVKPIARLLSQEGEMSEALWRLAEWMSHYYCTPLAKVLKCFIPANIRKEIKPKTQVLLKVVQSHAATLKAIEALRTKAPAQAELLSLVLNAPKGLYLSDIEQQRSSVASLLQKKWIYSEKVIRQEDLLLEEEFFPTAPKKLNGEQKSCLQAIEASLDQNQFAVHLIYGVTGSGKTEVYMQAIQRALEQKKSAIMLVPEISLTSQTIERFRARFSEKIAILHHRRSFGERTSAWESLRKGEAKLVIGARSALFCPAQNLGLLIVDEEHDSSYKQSEEMPCYHGRDTAVMRAYLEKCPILLGSATPSLESFHNAKRGKYQLHSLQMRATSAPLPQIHIVDMRKAFAIAGGFTHFSEELLEGLKKRIAAGEQTLLFLNRRGFHRLQMCRACQHILKCPHCDLSLTFHKGADLLQCHLCDYRRPTPRSCPACQQTDALSFKGFGTEHVERTLHALFPDIRTLRMDRDTTGKKNSHEELFQQFRAHKADVLIGTQMIAKGFHFPAVTLVGVLHPDGALNIPDFRASERAFQLLTQVAGRAGRAELPGEVIIQTFLPDHPLFALATTQNYDSFYQTEVEERRLFGYPPFCHLIKLLFSDPDPAIARERAENAHRSLRLPSHAHAFPVMPAGHAKVKDLYRFQFLIKTPKLSDLSDQLKEIKNARVDVDPVSIYF